ncbi:nitronate monooxygenase, partial [Geobacillus thermodenitrificans]
IERQGGTYEDLKEYISGEANRRFIYEGKVEEGFAWAGQAIGLIRDIPSVAELFARMIGEAEQIRRRWAN